MGVMFNMRAKRNRSVYFLAICSLILVFLYAASESPCGWQSIISTITWSSRCDSKYRQIACYENSTGNVLESLRLELVKPNTSIWFVETTCLEKGEGFKLSARQACAVESAARLHPYRDVYLLFPSPVYSTDTSHQPYLKALQSYDNIKLRHVFLPDLFVGTPLLSKWLTDKAGLSTSLWPRSHASDVIRYTLLWKFGGVYVDLDVILFRSFDSLRWFAGAESVSAVAAGVMALGRGSLAADLCIKDLLYGFRGDDWGNNGPGVITRVMKKLCHTNQVPELFNKTCGGVTVTPPKVFYPIRWQDWKLYFIEDEEKAETVMKLVNRSVGVHVWNSHSHGTSVWKGSRQPYTRLMATYCPAVYSAVPDNALF